jgi:RHS repeat-associated protein
VLVTISDKKLAVDSDNDGVVNYYNADVVTANDYYPFGSQMPGRKFSQANSSYRYGFNGKENDNEAKGEGNQQDYGMRPYDTRLARLISVDPLTPQYPFLTPYQFAENNPIENIDFLGMQGSTTTGVSSPTMPALSNWSVGANGSMSNSTQLINGPINSGAYAPQSHFITQAQFENFVPPYGGASINLDKTSVTVFGANGTSWQESLLRPAAKEYKVYSVGDLIKSGDEQFKANQQAKGMMEFKASIYSEKPTPLVIRALTPPAAQSPSNSSPLNNKETPKLYLIRRGTEPESADRLSTDAQRAEKADKRRFGHGVSTTMKNRVSGTDKKASRSALLSDVAKVFTVKPTPTENNPNHVTVVLPNPVTKEVAAKFNALFKTQ